MRGIATVGPGSNVSASPRRAAGAAVAEGTAVGKSCPNRSIRVQVADAIAVVCSLPLDTREFALEELATAANRAKGIALDDEDGRVPGVGITSASTGLILQGFGDSDFGGVGGLGLVSELGHCHAARNA